MTGVRKRHQRQWGWSAAVWIPTAIAIAFLLIPLLGLLLDTPWGRALSLLRSSTLFHALWLSLVVSAGAVVLTILFGSPLAWVISRRAGRWRGTLRLLVIMPMVMPPVVSGIALLSVFSERRLLGRVLAEVGISLPYTVAGAITAVTFVSMPFYVLALEAGLTAADRRTEEAAEVYGASPGRMLWSVILPSVHRALLAGVALSWARALGEFGATITFNGSMRGQTQTLPLAILHELQTDVGAAQFLSVVLLVVSVTILVLLRGRLFGEVRP